MNALAVLLAAVNLAGVFPPEVKTVGVVMPASVLDRKKFDSVYADMTNAGYRVKLASRMSFDRLASVDDRARDFEEMWLDPEVDLVLCARGGDGAEDMMMKLDWEKLRARPDRKVLGFSNITWPLNLMLKKGIGHPISGSSMQHFTYMGGDTAEWLARCLSGAKQPVKRLKALKAGGISGLPCGGHVHAVLHGLRRDVMPAPEGRIVFIETSAYADFAELRDALDEIVASEWLKRTCGAIFGTLQVRGGSAGDDDRLKAAFAAKSPVPVYDGYEYGHVPVLHAIDFLRKVSVSEDGTMVWE